MRGFQAAKELALQAGLLLRFEAQLPVFLQRRVSVEESKREIQAQVERRPETFLNTVREAIYARPECVYSRMLKWAGVEYGDLESLVSKDGIEGALDRLREAGVTVSTDEIKGLRPLARGGLKIEVRSEDFDNPLVERAYRGSSSGSSGHGRASHVSLAALEQNAMLKRLYQHATGMDRMPGLLWRAVPPGVSGMANFLEYHLMGNPFQAWYTPTHSGNWRSWLVTQLSLSMCVISGQETAWPRYLPLTDAWKISNLLAERKRRGEPAMRVDTVASGAARICAAALERNMDISGTCFRVSGEPFSASKEELFKRAGCLAWCTWAMSEAGTLGGGCANRKHRDEVHIALNKVALTTGEAESGGATPLYLTTIHPCTPKLMLNFDTGDHAHTTGGECGCELERAGLRTRIHSIRNGKKFTAGGMTFPAADLIRVVEEFLPSKFGGLVGDYQLVETEENGMPRVLLLASPEVGPMDEAALEEAVIDELSSRDVGTAMMAGQWRTGGVVKVVRERPWRTQTAKTPAFRMLRPPA